MYSRVTLLEVDTVRVDMGAAVELFRDDVLPRLREQEGFEGVLVLGTPEGKAMLVTLWATESAAAAGTEAGFYTEELARHATLFRAPPGREQYKVLLSEGPALVTG